MIRVVLLALAALAFAAGPAQARSCGNPAFPGSGYFTSLAVTGTTCATGKAVAVAWTKCRRENGPKGRCTHKVKGYACTEKRVSIATEFDGVVSCRDGGKRVKFSYQQNT